MARSRKGRFTFGSWSYVLLAATVAGGTVVGVPLRPAAAAGGVAITEVAPWASGNSTYGADWFEVTNTNPAALDITGWRLDDSSAAYASSVALTGVTSIGPGESVIFLETSTPATTVPAFTSAWFDGAVPSGLQVGTYSGSGVGLSTGGDAVNLFDGTGTLRASVTFGASPTAAPFASFDNAAGVDGAISTVSAEGVNGAFLVTTGTPAIGSPGRIAGGAPPPPPTTTTVPSTTTTVPSSGRPWPGDSAVTNASSFAFGGNLSGLIEEPTTGARVLWAVRNGPGSLFRLVGDGITWAPDSGGGWAPGKLLRYPDGTGEPDAEGVTFAGASAVGGIFVASERNNLVNTVSRLSVLRYDPSATGTTLTATAEWDLTSDLPAVGANLGLEAITWVPDASLLANGFVDERTGAPYAPVDYPGHGTGLFFVGVEATGTIYAYALQDGGAFARVATIASTFPAVMELQFDRDLDELWAVCDNTCNGRHALLRLDPTTGRFRSVATFERPTGMPNLNNEGFAIAPASTCAADRKAVYWADDGETGGVAIRGGTIPCAPFDPGPSPVIAEFPTAALPTLAALGIGGALLVLSYRRRRHALPTA